MEENNKRTDRLVLLAFLGVAVFILVLGLNSCEREKKINEEIAKVSELYELPFLFDEVEWEYQKSSDILHGEIVIHGTEPAIEGLFESAVEESYLKVRDWTSYFDTVDEMMQDARRLFEIKDIECPKMRVNLSVYVILDDGGFAYETVATCRDGQWDKTFERWK